MIGNEEDFREWCELHDYEEIDGLNGTQIARILERATQELEGRLNRKLTIVEDQTQLAEGVGRKYLVLDDELVVVDSVTVDGSEVDSGNYRGYPYGQFPIVMLERTDGGVWPKGLDILVTGDFGYKPAGEMPELLEEVVYVLAATDMWSDSGDVKTLSLQGLSVTMASGEEQNRQLDTLLTNHKREF